MRQRVIGGVLAAAVAATVFVMVFGLDVVWECDPLGWGWWWCPA